MEDQRVPVPGYPGLYWITKAGTITNARRKTISSRIDRGNYITLRLTKNGVTRTHFLHRLLATVFIPNPDELPIVNHRDGNKLNNALDNLEWLDFSGNVLHAYRTGLIRRKRCREVVDECTGVKYISVREAAACLGIPYSTCKNYLNGTRRNPTCLRLRA